MSGVSFIVCVGRPAWPRVEACENFLRIVLGPIAFWLLFHDFEILLDKMRFGPAARFTDGDDG